MGVGRGAGSVNYYPFHIGDYLSATRHLSWEEDAAYRRLLDTYYTNEKPLPADLRAVCRLVLAQTEAQREAVRVVLEEFFELTDAGWVNGRADAEILAMREKQQKQRDKANKRWAKPLTESGKAPAMPRHEDSDAAASIPHADAMPPTPTRTPTPTPIEEIERAHPAGPKSDERAPIGTPAGRICKALRAAGISSVNPGDPRLLALLAQGATEEEFVSLADDAKAKGAGFAWLLAALVGRRAEAAAIVLAAAPVAKVDQSAKTVPSSAADATAALLRAEEEHRREMIRQRDERRAKLGTAA